MNVNISLADTPAVSAFFDGQPIQDELEAEIRREEEQQEKELRDLLATELEDFEDDFLSDSNSDEDSVNISRTSRASSHQRVRQNESLKEPPKSSQRHEEISDGSSRIKNNPSKDLLNQLPCEPYISPSSQRNPPLFHTTQEPFLQQLQNQPANHQYPLNSQQDNMDSGPVHNGDADEWMMRIETQTMAVSSPASPYCQTQLLHQQQ